MGTSSSLGQFLKKYGSESKCLKAIKNLKYPNGIFCQSCNQVTKFYRVKGRPLYECSCGFQVSVLKGTIFKGTKIPLRYWCYAIFVMSNTRSGVSAKTLQRELGVAYETAWNMFRQVRLLMDENSQVHLKGTVEIDETYVGGKGYNRGKKWWANHVEHPKQTVMGIVERNGRVITKHVPDNSRYTLMKEIKKSVRPWVRIMTDQWEGYWSLTKEGYNHQYVTHSKYYVRGDVYTQNIENFWSHLKRGLVGVYRHVSPKYLQSYVNEFAFRYNHRWEPERMFEILLERTTGI